MALAELQPRRERPTVDAGRVPPHNLEAEESLLGAMLLSRDAISAASEVGVGAADFYRPAHGHVFDAVTGLYSHGDPVDPVTVAEALSRAGLLEAIGGPGLLVSLQARTPATSSAARYARIVSEHALLRRLIGVAGEIAEIGYSLPDDVIAAIDRAEAMVFDVAERRVSDTMAPLKDLLDASLTRLELLYERGDSITGVATGYHDLDELLSGLQPSSLVIVGARPAIGKTAFSLGMAAHAAVEANRPVLFFSLEMSHHEVTSRLLSAEARVDGKKMRNGKLAEADWVKISHAIGRLADAPLFIDDNPQATVMDIRAKARRLKAREGDLGLVMVDYLQLMTGRNTAENRQVEVSEISRGLKILARELECPVVAMSQLSRQLELRADKRPMLADLRESGCLTAETRLLRADTNAEVALGELLSSGARDVPVWSLDDDWRLVPATLTHAFPSGVKPVFRLKLASGRTVDATATHRFRTLDGWTALGDLGPGDRLAVPRRLDAPEETAEMPEAEVVLLAHLLGSGCVLPRRPVHYTSADERNLEAVEQAAADAFGITARRVRQGGWWHSYLPAPRHLTHGTRNPIAAWWDGLGPWDCRSHQKSVPDAVFQLPREQVALFLRHLWATDGWLTVGRGRRDGQVVRCHYASSSRRLVDGVRQLLLRFGIQTRLTVVPAGRGRESYHLRVDGAEHLRRFLAEIGVHGQRGDVAPLALGLLEGVAGNPDVDTIPFDVRADVVAALAGAGMTARQLAAAIGEDHCGSSLLGSASRPRTSSRARLERMAEALDDKGLLALATSDVLWDTVVAIEPLGERPVYDATVLGTHNFIANGVVAHNSLEQDADVVMFLYRDEIYNPESPDRGTAEVLVSKHRAGPTGVVRLAFLDHITRFANMAKGV